MCWRPSRGRWECTLPGVTTSPTMTTWTAGRRTPSVLKVRSVARRFVRVMHIDLENVHFFIVLAGVWVGNRVATAMAYLSDFQGKYDNFWVE